jgi:hypothetical protein
MKQRLLAIEGQDYLLLQKVVLWKMRLKVSSNNSGIFLVIWPRVALE